MALDTGPTTVEDGILSCFGAPMLALPGCHVHLSSHVLFSHRLAEHHNEVDRLSNSAVAVESTPLLNGLGAWSPLSDGRHRLHPRPGTLAAARSDQDMRSA
ncbi:hypothetical protein, conserved [Leishmania lindenbergi]|uniref:Uncharacterized protein n=1 Tax=Leishmania lindenbergi TaxID=651832 RepID=A0AAW3AUT6_9TRYP